MQITYLVDKQNIKPAIVNSVIISTSKRVLNLIRVEDKPHGPGSGEAFEDRRRLELFS